MAVWMEYEQFRKQIEEGADIEARAPCPAESDAGGSTPYWVANYPIEFEVEAENAALPARVDVAIIGSGITGAVVAYELSRQKPNLNVAVLEARGICTGATGRNGGHVSRPETYDMRYLAQFFGDDEAIRLRRLPILTRDMLLQTVEDIGAGGKVDLQLGGTYNIFGSQEERQDNENDMAYAKRIGMPIESYIMSGDELSQRIGVEADTAMYGAAVLEKFGSFYPRKFVAELFAHSLKRMPNLSLHSHTPVSSVTQDENGIEYTVGTSEGSIKARAVVHATNAWASHLIPSLQGSNGVFGVKCHVISVHPTSPDHKQFKCGFGYDRMWHWGIRRPGCGPLIYGWSGTEKIADYDDSTIVTQEEAYKTMFDFLHKVLPSPPSTRPSGERGSWISI
ncbi:putative oxidoreductase OrdL [Colletotrichum asianum]|uniref:Putative oxidoreductase OrdL n=1 Tax=Colletotrichum asianum TaxID=702518 RepID=A0A8H3W1I2_9PEZI|nr:putative oxidoreductase OrdL [Colletotrichum asianum]